MLMDKEKQFVTRIFDHLTHKTCFEAMYTHQK